MIDNRERTNANIDNFFSITPSGFFGKGVNNIVELENFMTKEEQEILYDFAKNNKN
jgi:hypothetical protein